MRLELTRANSLRAALLAGFAARAWAAISLLLVVPLYIRWLGVEAYGLIGIFAMLQSMLGFLDFGFRSALARELSRLSTDADGAAESRDLVRTLEPVYWLVALALAAACVPMASWVAQGWLTPKHLSRDVIESAAVLFVLSLAVQFPVGLYWGALLGLRRHVLWNLSSAVFTTLRTFGAFAVLVVVSPSLRAFAAFQLLVAALQVAVTAAVVWSCLPRGQKSPAFRRDLLRRVLPFSGSVTFISVLTFFTAQADRLVLSLALPLDAFGYYSIAVGVAGAMAVLSGPLFEAVFPRFSTLVGQSERGRVSAFYHQACQVACVLFAPIGITLAAFAPQVLAAWTARPDVVESSSSLVGLLAITTAVWALGTVPYALQLAQGWAGLALATWSLQLAVLVPSILVAVSRAGLAGAAAAVLAVASTATILSVLLMHRRLLTGEGLRWLLADTVLPSAAAALVVVLSRRMWLAPPLGVLATVALVLTTWLAATLAAAYAAPQVRSLLLSSAAEAWKSMRGRRIRMGSAPAGDGRAGGTTPGIDGSESQRPPVDSLSRD